MPSTIIIGAGWAGLMCAYTLAKHGHQVTLIEAAPHIGGRARSIAFANHIVDNGQHVCLGAYHTLFALLQELNIEPRSQFEILPLNLVIYAAKKLQIKLPKLAAPYNLLFGFLTAKNLSWRAKRQIISLWHQLKKINFTLAHDHDLLTCLKNYHQSDYTIKHIWEPIALATMTTPIHLASAQVFFNILQQCFNAKANASNWCIPKTDLSNLLPNTLHSELLKLGCKVITSQAIVKIELIASCCYSVYSKTASWAADNFVVATPPWVAANLLAQHPTLQDTYAKVNKFTTQPIITIYYEFAHAVNLPHPIIGMLDTIGQWIFDRSCVTQPNILSVVISGPGQHQTISHDQLASTVIQELQKKFPHLCTPLRHKIINDKKAAFSCNFTTQGFRPQPRTTVQNLWLAGDYLQTGLPATLEGALISGKQTGDMILGYKS